MNMAEDGIIISKKPLLPGKVVCPMHSHSLGYKTPQDFFSHMDIDHGINGGSPVVKALMRSLFSAPVPTCMRSNNLPVCFECSKIFTQPIQYMKHLTTEHNIFLKLACLECDFLCESHEALKSHIISSHQSNELARSSSCIAPVLCVRDHEFKNVQIPLTTFNVAERLSLQIFRYFYRPSAPYMLAVNCNCGIWFAEANEAIDHVSQASCSVACHSCSTVYDTPESILKHCQNNYTCEVIYHLNDFEKYFSEKGNFLCIDREKIQQNSQKIVIPINKTGKTSILPPVTNLQTEIAFMNDNSQPLGKGSENLTIRPSKTEEKAVSYQKNATQKHLTKSERTKSKATSTKRSNIKLPEKINESNELQSGKPEKVENESTKQVALLTHLSENDACTKENAFIPGSANCPLMCSSENYWKNIDDLLIHIGDKHMLAPKAFLAKRQFAAPPVETLYFSSIPPCFICCVENMNPAQFKDHMTVTHSLTLMYDCPVCLKLFENIESFKAHHEDNHSSLEYKYSEKYQPILARKISKEKYVYIECDTIEKIQTLQVLTYLKAGKNGYNLLMCACKEWFPTFGRALGHVIVDKPSCRILCYACGATLANETQKIHNHYHSNPHCKLSYLDANRILGEEKPGCIITLRKWCLPVKTVCPICHLPMLIKDGQEQSVEEMAVQHIINEHKISVMFAEHLVALAFAAPCPDKIQTPQLPRCFVCSAKTLAPYGFDRHIQSHNIFLMFECPVCHLLIKNVVDLESHCIETHTSLFQNEETIRLLSSGVSPMLFSTSSTSSHPSKIILNRTDKLITLQILRFLVKQTYKQCGDCFCWFNDINTIDDLNKHKQIHGLGCNLTCHTCGSTFQRSNFKEHMQHALCTRPLVPGIKLISVGILHRQTDQSSSIPLKVESSQSDVTPSGIYSTHEASPLVSKIDTGDKSGNDTSNNIPCIKDTCRNYSCPICHTSFLKISDVVQHMKNKHDMHLGWTCVKCKQFFDKMISLRNHYEKHMFNSTFIDHCITKTYPGFSIFKRERSHFVVLNACLVAGPLQEFLQTMKNHSFFWQDVAFGEQVNTNPYFVNQHGDISTTCPFCEFQFDECSSKIADHIRFKHFVPNIVAKRMISFILCGKMSKSEQLPVDYICHCMHFACNAEELYSHLLLTHSTGLCYVCPEPTCSLSFQSTEDLLMHFSEHHPAVEYDFKKYCANSLPILTDLNSTERCLITQTNVYGDYRKPTLCLLRAALISHQLSPVFLKLSREAFDKSFLPPCVESKDQLNDSTCDKSVTDSLSKPIPTLSSFNQALEHSPSYYGDIDCNINSGEKDLSLQHKNSENKIQTELPEERSISSKEKKLESHKPIPVLQPSTSHRFTAVGDKAHTDKIIIPCNVAVTMESEKLKSESYCVPPFAEHSTPPPCNPVEQTNALVDPNMVQLNKGDISQRTVGLPKDDPDSDGQSSNRIAYNSSMKLSSSDRNRRRSPSPTYDLDDYLYSNATPDDLEDYLSSNTGIKVKDCRTKDDFEKKVNPITDLKMGRVVNVDGKQYFLIKNAPLCVQKIS